MYRSIEDIRTEYEKRAREYKVMREAWQAVTIKTRKNGSEYARLTAACLDGATIDTAWNGLKRLHVGGWCTGYVSDEIDIEKYSSDSSNVIEAMAPEEARAAIEYRIGWLAKQEETARAAAEWLTENTGRIFDQVEEFRTTLTEGAPDRGHMMWALGEVVGDLIKFDSNRRYWR